MTRIPDSMPWPRGRGRSGAAGTPWATGVTLAVMVCVLSGVVTVAFGSLLAEIHASVAVVVNAVIFAGLVPTLLVWVRLPVWRWIACGVGVGVFAGWVALLVA